VLYYLGSSPEFALNDSQTYDLLAPFSQPNLQISISYQSDELEGCHFRLSSFFRIALRTIETKKSGGFERRVAQMLPSAKPLTTTTETRLHINVSIQTSTA